MSLRSSTRSLARRIPGAPALVAQLRTSRRQLRTAYLKTRYPAGSFLRCGPFRIFCDFDDPTYAWYDGFPANLKFDAEIIERLVPQSSGQILLDVGAHCGFFTLLFARCAQARPGMRVIAIEPDARHFRCLERTVGPDDASIVTLVRGAVGDHDGTLDLYRTRHSCLHTYPEQGASRVDSVRAFTVDSLVRELAPRGQVALLKVDVDGAEPSVVAGARRALLEDEAILLMEFAPAQLRSGGHDPAAFLAELIGGFHVHAISYAETTVRPLGESDISSLIDEIGDAIADLIVSRRAIDLTGLRVRR